VGVEANHLVQIFERISLLSSNLDFLDWANDGLDFIRVDNTGDVSVRENSGWEVESLLLSRSGEVSIDLIQFLESGFGPDDKSSEMSSRSEFEKVEARDIADIDSGQVTESMGEFLLSVVDDERSLSLNISSVSPLSFSCTDVTSSLDTFNIRVCSELFEELDCCLGLLNIADGCIGNDERDFLDSRDTMSSCLDERSHSSCCKSRCGCESLLVLVDSSMPSSPDFGWCEHSSSSAHVSESSLSCSVGSRS